MFRVWFLGRSGRTAATAVMALAVAAPAARAATIGDGAFNDTNWSITKFANLGSNVSGSQVTIGGNPGDYRQVIDSVASASRADPNSKLVGVNIYLPGVYDPATHGALGAIDFAMDTICAAPACYGAGQGAGFAVAQGGNFYINAQFDTGLAGSGWIARAYTLGAADFSLVDLNSVSDTDPSHHPDFSVNGAPMQFGFVTLNSAVDTGYYSGYSVASGYDNWSTNVPIPGGGGVPEPATWAVMLMGFGGLGAALRRRSAACAG